MPKPHKYRELVRILKDFDARFQFIARRGKGSHRMVYHPSIDGRAESFPLKCHGENTELSKGVIGDLVRRFKLPSDLL